MLTADDPYETFHKEEIALKIENIAVDHNVMCLIDLNKNTWCLPTQIKLDVSAGDSVWKPSQNDTCWIFKYQLYRGYTQTIYQVVQKN